MTGNDFFVERDFCNAFLSHASEVRPFVRPCVRACMHACSRACVRERNTEKFGLSSPLPPSLHLLLLPRLFRPLFLPLASHSPEAKEARVLLRLTFSGMNYLARQVPVSDSRYCDFAIRRRNTRWEYPPRADDGEIVTLFKAIDNINDNDLFSNKRN